MVRDEERGGRVRLMVVWWVVISLWTVVGVFRRALMNAVTPLGGLGVS